MRGGEGSVRLTARANGDHSWRNRSIRETGYGGQKVHTGDDGSVGAIGCGATKPSSFRRLGFDCFKALSDLAAQAIYPS
ncbi:MAG: hypothetical protein ACI9GK_001049 [Devosia sp.]